MTHLRINLKTVSVNLGPGALGHALQAGLSTDCGLLAIPASGVQSHRGWRKGKPRYINM